MKIDVQMIHFGNRETAEKVRKAVERHLQVLMHNEMVTAVLTSAEPVS